MCFFWAPRYIDLLGFNGAFAHYLHHAPQDTLYYSGLCRTFVLTLGILRFLGLEDTSLVPNRTESRAVGKRWGCLRMNSALPIAFAQEIQGHRHFIALAVFNLVEHVNAPPMVVGLSV